MSVCFFGSYNLNTTPRVQTLIDGLRGHSITVKECNVPLMVSTAERIAIAEHPWRLPLFGLKVLRCWVKLVSKRRQASGSKHIIVGYLGQFDVLLAKMIFPTKHIMLDYMISGAATVQDRGLGGRVKNYLLVWLDTLALRAATTIIVDTDEHFRDIAPKFRPKCIVVSVGAPQSWFETPRPRRLNQSRTFSVIFFGLYTPLQGTVTIGKALAELTQPIEVTMAGSGQEYAAAKRAAKYPKNTTKITWIDWADPSQIARHDVTLGIFGSGPKALKVVPNKIYQGAALGCGLVTSDTPPQRRALGDVALFVPPDDARRLALVLDDLAAHPNKVAKLRKQARAYSQAHFTPKKIVEPLISLINQT